MNTPKLDVLMARYAAIPQEEGSRIIHSAPEQIAFYAVKSLGDRHLPALVATLKEAYAILSVYSTPACRDAARSIELLLTQLEQEAG